MTVKKMGRRMFLLGAGGAALSIPFLPSLLPRNAARAQDPVPPRRFVAMRTDHGGVWGEYMWPDDSMAGTPEMALSSEGHTVHHGALVATQEGDDSVLSDVIRGRSSIMTPALIGKMNLLRGLDVPWYCAHGHHVLGNYGPMALAEATSLPDQATLDQYLAWSPSFYEITPRKRSMHIGQNMSVTWNSPETRSGGFLQTPSSQSSLGLFSEIHVPMDMPGGPAPRPPVTDRLLESYRRLRSGAHGPGARLGSDDRLRLDAYMERISALDAALNAGVAAACNEVTMPSMDAFGTSNAYTQYANNPEWYGPNWYQLYNDIIVAAFMCDSSRVATIGSNEDWNGTFNDAPYNGYHHGVAHPAAWDRSIAELLITTNRGFFQMVFLDLIRKLDSVPDVDGTTLLDNSLVWWTHESGPETHHNDSQPVITAGSAGGQLNTGLYVDYRNRDASFPGTSSAGGAGRRPGLHYYQWFTTVLDVLGVPRSEWQTGTQPFSPSVSAPSWMYNQHPYVDAILGYCNQPLPVISNIG